MLDSPLQSNLCTGNRSGFISCAARPPPLFPARGAVAPRIALFRPSADHRAHDQDQHADERGRGEQRDDQHVQ
ncbi:hypothetical protein, partial [Burkholderia multivorans]|uniref:hypothetical protein n=1 Tax=Burkholderia multivorans TaxID=87883 RepID=UPI001C661C14